MTSPGSSRPEPSPRSLGGPDRAGAFWDHYCERSPAPTAELVAHLAAFHPFRAAVQAAYLSSRVADADLTSIADQQENWKGLRDAQRLLSKASAPTPPPNTAGPPTVSPVPATTRPPGTCTTTRPVGG